MGVVFGKREAVNPAQERRVAQLAFIAPPILGRRPDQRG
jgi:hypothetical protein